MTYDRNYTWSKEYPSEVISVVKNMDFKYHISDEINAEDVDLSNEKWIKLKIQKMLNKVDLMNYGTEYGQKIILNSTQNKQKLICKAWCLSDHIIGIEIEHENFDSNALKEIKQRFENQFWNYKIIWTEI